MPLGRLTSRASYCCHSRPEIDLRQGAYYLVDMTLRSIITLPDPRLRLVSAPVPAVDDSIRALMDDMLETMYAAPGVGLAAIQIAVPKRVIVLDVAKREAETAQPQPLCLANPEIIWASEERSTCQEGCLSIPDVFEDIERLARVRAHYLDREGRAQEIEAEGVLATCLQHEIDHLNGVLFIDHISRLKRELLMRKFRKTAKQRANSGKAGAAKERIAASTKA
jgi:peptide deformylase